MKIRRLTKKAIPLGLVMAAVEATDISCPFVQYQADLIQIALFSCLRLCKYTKMNSYRRTIQFCIKDFQFNDADGVVPHNSSSKTSLCVRAVTLFLDIQNNSVQGDSTTMEDTNLAHGDPISTVARRFPHLCSHHSKPGTTI